MRLRKAWVPSPPGAHSLAPAAVSALCTPLPTWQTWEGKEPCRCRGLPVLCSSQLPTCLAQASAPGSGSLDGKELWTGMSDCLAAAVGRLHTCWPVPSSPVAFPEPLGYTPATIFKSNHGCSGPSLCPSRSGPGLTSCLAGLIPHSLPTPDRQAHPAQSPTFSGTDPVSRLLPAPEQSSSSLRPCLVWYHLTL